MVDERNVVDGHECLVDQLETGICQHCAASQACISLFDSGLGRIIVSSVHDQIRIEIPGLGVPAEPFCHHLSGHVVL